MKAIFSFLALTLLVGAQPAIAPPQVGFVVDANKSLRPVLGIAGNMLLGDSISEGVASASWSGAYGLVKTDSSLMALDAEGQTLAAVDADAGPALFAFGPKGVPGLVLLPDSGLIYRWKGDHFEQVVFSSNAVAGDPVAIAVSGPTRASLLVQREDALWRVEISTISGELLSQTALPGINLPAHLERDGSVLYADQTDLVIRDRSGNERRIEMGWSIAQIDQMGAGWYHLVETDSNRHFAVKTNGITGSVTELPEAQ